MIAKLRNDLNEKVEEAKVLARYWDKPQERQTLEKAEKLLKAIVRDLDGCLSLTALEEVE